MRFRHQVQTGWLLLVAIVPLVFMAVKAAIA